jgi:anti-sigma B factor antagonist
MELRERQANGVSIIDISGDLVVPAENPRQLRDRVMALLNRGERRILLNFQGLQHMDSSCLGEVVESYKITAANGGALKLANVSPQLQSLLKTTKLDKIIQSFDTEEAAFESFASTHLAEPSRTVFSSAAIFPNE